MSRYHRICDRAIAASREFPSDELIPTLSGNKGTWLPEVVDEPPFDAARQVEGQAVTVIEAERVLVSCPVRAKTAEEVAAMRTAKLAEITAEARRRILAMNPDWKQANLTARGVELLRLRQDRAWTPDEQAEVDALQAVWDAIKAVRARSNELEASVPTEAAGVAAFDATQGWD